jgi:hypothetical protein
VTITVANKSNNDGHNPEIGKKRSIISAKNRNIRIFEINRRRATDLKSALTAKKAPLKSSHALVNGE